MAAPDTDAITAVVVSHDSEQALPECLRSLRDAGLTAIVVDNASQDGTVAQARAAGATIIANEENQGYGRAVNQALKAAASEFCLILNPDVSFDSGAPGQLLALLRAQARAAAIAPKLIERDGRIFELSASPINPPAAHAQFDGAASRGLLSGAALLARRERLLAIGGFDPNIFLFWDDNDLCRRLVDAGDMLLLADAVFMKHSRGASSTVAPGSIYARRWHQAWSRFYVFKKFGVASDADRWVSTYTRKAMLAGLFGASRRVERYRGSLDGALAFHSGETALAHQGLA
ncbi:MAG: glycosyltransferase [Proteobacteria bacterium]|nr:glycosyltransferase [Pseudomonadota bacterium]